MFKQAALIATMFAIAGPVSANETTDFMAEQLGLEPGVYTLSEIFQIQSAKSTDRKRRIELIDRQKEAFRQAVRGAMSSGAPVLSSR